MDASMLSEEQFSALELMMSHADEAHVLSQGAPKRKRQKKSLAEQFPEGFEFFEEYVGTGSRAANREMRARQAEKAAKPNNREVVKALETAFAEQSDDAQDIVKSVNETTQSTKAVAKTLADWLKWTKDRAFLDDHKARTDESISPPTSPRGAGNSAGDDEDGLGADDFIRDRNGNRTNRKRPKRRRSRTMRRLNRFGKSRAGKIAGLVALAATGLGIASWMKSDTSDNLEQGSDNYGDEQATPVEENPVVPNATNENPVSSPEIPRTPNATVPLPQSRPSDSMTDEQIDAYEEKRDKQDTTAAVVSTGGMLLAGSRRIPGVGAVVQAGEGIYNGYQIANDPTLSDEEKHKEQVKNITSTGGAATGATIGAWAGGAVGSIVPVFGTAIGATLGGLLGGYLGDMIGEYVGEKITNETDEAVEEDRKRREDEDRKASLIDNPVAQKYSPPIFMPLALGGASPTGAAGGFNYGYGGGGPARFPGQTSQRANDIAQKVLSSEKIGGVSEQFESGGRGVGTVSSGAGDYGGVSYGKHQLASANGSMSQFLASKEAGALAGDFAGLTPGTASFNERYKQVAATRGKEMEDAQYQYLVRTHYAPTAEKLEKNLGIDMDKQGRAFKEMVYSTSMQYGGNAADKIQRAFKGKDFNSMSEQERIEAVQQDKLANVQQDFRSSSAAVQQGVADRTQRELAVLKKVHEGDQPKATEAPTEVAKTEPTKESVEAQLSKPGDAPRTPTQAAASKEDLETARATVHKEITGKEIQPQKEIPWEQQSVEQKEATLAQMRDKKDFLEKKVAYIKAHPEITRDDDKKVDEIVREQQRQSKNVVGAEQDGTAVVRAESLSAKEQSAPDVERAKPLEEMPVAAAPEQPVADQTASIPSGGARSSDGNQSSGGGSGRSAGSPSLDDIPVILDDPLLNMINVGYV